MGWGELEKDKAKAAVGKAKFALRDSYEVKLLNGVAVGFLYLGEPVRTVQHWVNGRTIDCVNDRCCERHGPPQVKYIVPGVGLIDDSEKPVAFYVSVSVNVASDIKRTWDEKAPRAIIVERQGFDLEDTEYKVYPDTRNRYTDPAALEKIKARLEPLELALANAYPQASAEATTSAEAPPPLDDGPKRPVGKVPGEVDRVRVGKKAKPQAERPMPGDPDLPEAPPESEPPL